MLTDPFIYICDSGGHVHFNILCVWPLHSWYILKCSTWSSACATKPTFNQRSILFPQPHQRHFFWHYSAQCKTLKMSEMFLPVFLCLFWRQSWRQGLRTSVLQSTCWIALSVNLLDKFHAAIKKILWLKTESGSMRRKWWIFFICSWESRQGNSWLMELLGWWGGTECVGEEVCSTFRGLRVHFQRAGRWTRHTLDVCTA